MFRSAGSVYGCYQNVNPYAVLLRIPLKKIHLREDCLALVTKLTLSHAENQNSQ